MNLVDRWHAFWFREESPVSLALLRIVLFGLLFFYYLPADYRPLGDPSLAPFWRPVFPLLLIPLPTVSSETLALMQVAWKLSLLLACIGLMTRLATLSAFLIGSYLIAIAQSYAVMSHVDAAIPLVLGVMAAARCNHALALDRRVFRRPAMPPSGDYRWPLQATRLITVFVLFNGGVSKLRHSGLEWAFSENLSIVMLQNQHYYTPHPPLTTWGVDLAPIVWFTQMLAFGTLLIELGMPLALVSDLARRLLVPSALMMFVAIRLLLGPDFTPFIICLVACWPNWASLARKFVDARPQLPTFLLRWPRFLRTIIE